LRLRCGRGRRRRIRKRRERRPAALQAVVTEAAVAAAAVGNPTRQQSQPVAVVAVVAVVARRLYVGGAGGSGYDTSAPYYYPSSNGQSDGQTGYSYGLSSLQCVYSSNSGPVDVSSAHVCEASSASAKEWWRPLSAGERRDDEAEMPHHADGGNKGPSRGL